MSFRHRSTGWCEGDRHDTETGAGQDIAGPISRLCSRLSPNRPLLEPRVDRGQRDDDAGDHQGRDQDVQAEGVAECLDLPVRHDAQRTIEPSDVPVRLGARGHLIGVYGPKIQIGLICTSRR